MCYLLHLFTEVLWLPCAVAGRPADGPQCWVAVTTPSHARRVMERFPLHVQGQYNPQTREYLKGVAGELYGEFEALLAPFMEQVHAIGLRGWAGGVGEGGCLAHAWGNFAVLLLGNDSLTTCHAHSNVQTSMHTRPLCAGRPAAAVTPAGAALGARVHPAAAGRAMPGSAEAAVCGVW